MCSSDLLVFLAGGARGVLYLRWRSLLDGPLFGAFGLYSNDGTPNERSAEAAKIAHWANSAKTSALFAAKPRKAGVGIVVYDQAQEFNRIIAQAGAQKFYARCQWGAYRMFFDARIPVDFVHFDDIGEYDTLYFAYPIQLDAADAVKLADWVRGGGRLVCEGLPGYFGDGGHVGAAQPNNGLDAVFGVKEMSVEFMPDIGERIRFNVACGGGGAAGCPYIKEVQDVPGGLFRQSYTITGAEALGAYTDADADSDNEAAIAYNRYGDGQAMLIGTYPSEGYFNTSSPRTLDMLKALLAKIGRLNESGLAASPMVQASVNEGSDGELFVWLVNHGDKPETAKLPMPEARGIGEVLWGQPDAASFNDGTITATIPAKDAIVVALNR